MAWKNIMNSHISNEILNDLQLVILELGNLNRYSLKTILTEITKKGDKILMEEGSNVTDEFVTFKQEYEKMVSYIKREYNKKPRGTMLVLPLLEFNKKYGKRY